MDIASVAAMVSWWVLFLILAGIGLPIAATVFAGLDDRGAGLAIPTAIVVLILPIYWLGHLRYNGIVIGVGVLVLLGVSYWCWNQGPTIDRRRIQEVAIVFTAGFGLVVAIRAADPSILPAGGEKFLDFGLLNAILRTDQLPPEDIWFAGEPVQYYYGGHLIAGVLTELTQTPPRYAYNIALAGFFGTLVAAAYGVAGSVAAGHGHRFQTAGGFAAVFVGFTSNLVPVVQVVVTALPDGIAAGISRWLAGRTALEAGRVTAFDTLTYWTASRVIRGTINEFPLFAWMNGDLHAHMMSTPFLLLGAGVAFAYFVTESQDIRRRRLLAFGAVPPVAGLIAVINTWSFPSVIGVIGLTLLFSPSDPRDLFPDILSGHSRKSHWREETRRLLAALVGAVMIAVLGILWTLPFFIGPATGASGRSIGFLPARSGLVEFLLVYGWLLLVFTLYLGGRARGEFGDRTGKIGLALGLVVILSLIANAAAVAVVLPILGVAWFLLRRETVGFESVLIVAGAGLVLLVEFVYVQEQAGPGRMNTVFKTYMQIWVLWATAAGAALVRIRPPRHPSVDPGLIARGLVALLVLSGSLYGLITLGIHFGTASEVTLDATTWAASTHSEEWEAIQYLGDQPGQPNIVSAPGCWCNSVESTRPYRWVNAPSSFTGIPTLAGWSHEVGYRGQGPYETRVEDVRTIYTGTADERRALLDRYDVEYIYVGPNERALYGDISFEGVDGVTVAFENQVVSIYRVN